MKLAARVIVVGGAVAACGGGASAPGPNPPSPPPSVVVPVASVAPVASSAANSTPPPPAPPKARVVVETSSIDASAGMEVDQENVVWIAPAKPQGIRTAADARDPEFDVAKLMRAPLAGGGKPEELATFSTGAWGLQVASDAYYVATPGLTADCKKNCGIVRIDRKDPKKVTTVVKGDDIGTFRVVGDQLYWLTAPRKAPPFSNKTLHSAARSGGGSQKVVAKIDVEKVGAVLSALEPMGDKGDKLGWLAASKKGSVWDVVPTSGGSVQTVLDLGEINPFFMYAVDASGVVVARHQGDAPGPTVLSRVPFVGSEKELGKLDADSKPIQLEEDDTGVLFVVVEDATKRDNYRILRIAPDGTQVIAEHQGDAPLLTLGPTAILWAAPHKDGSGAILAIDRKR